MDLFFTLDPKSQLFKGISRSLGMEFSPSVLFRFRDGETYFESKVSPSGSRVFLFQSFSFNVNDDLVNLLLAIDVLRRNGSKEIILVLPYLCYCRQDRQFFEYGSVSLRFIADLLCSAGATRLLTVDLHCPQTQGFFSVPLENISSMAHAAEEIKGKINLDNLVVVSPDAGGVRRAKEFSEAIGVDCFSLHKSRSKDGGLSLEMPCGNFAEGRDCLLVDDILGSGGTLIKSMEFLRSCGAKSISIYVTHALFSGDSLESFAECHRRGLFGRLYVSDSIGHDYGDYPFAEVISLSDLLAENIRKHRA